MVESENEFTGLQTNIQSRDSDKESDKWEL